MEGRIGGRDDPGGPTLAEEEDEGGVEAERVAEHREDPGEELVDAARLADLAETGEELLGVGRDLPQLVAGDLQVEAELPALLLRGDPRLLGRRERPLKLADAGLEREVRVVRAFAHQSLSKTTTEIMRLP